MDLRAGHRLPGRSASRYQRKLLLRDKRAAHLRILRNNNTSTNDKCDGTYTFGQWTGLMPSSDLAVLAYDAASVVANPMLSATFHTPSGSPWEACGAYAPQ